MTEKKKPRVVAIIQARMKSTRLPGKTLAEILGKPLLEHVIIRIRGSRTIDDIVVATTTEPEDEAILRLALRCGVKTYSGSSNDVLDRFYQAAKQSGADIVVRATADDPFKDPQVLDLIVRCMLSNKQLDYVSNTIVPTFPEGLDIEVISRKALERAWRESKLPSEREHVTPYIWKHPELFKTFNVKHSQDLSQLRWTIDCEEDLRFAREVYARLSGRGLFLMKDILDLLQAEPSLTKINQGIPRDEGYTRSLMRELR